MKNKLKIKATPALVVLLTTSSLAIAEESQPNLLENKEKVPESISQETLKDARKALAPYKDKQYVTLTVENDLFGAGTDQNYTSGVRLGWFNFGNKPFGLTKKIENLFPILETNESTSTYYSFGQNLFTPKDVESPQQDPTDRPWAAILYGSVGMVTLKDEVVDEIELSLGVVGPLALGEEAQKTVHNAINSTDPKGWDNQLENEPAFILSWQRRYPTFFETGVGIGNVSLSATPHVGLTLGNVYTYGAVGGSLKISSAQSMWDDKPMQVRPAMPGTGFFVPKRRVSWELFAGAEGRAMARNIFLDGNTFSSSYNVDKKPFVADLSAGGAVSFDKIRVTYTSTFRTKEFYGQEESSVFGGISLGVTF